MYASDDETPKGTSNEWMGGVGCDLESGILPICDSCLEESPVLDLFFGLWF